MRLHSQSGFTFIELLISLAIIATLFIPIMQLFSHSVYSSGISQDLITATNLAKWQMEKVKNLGYTKKQLHQLGDAVIPPSEELPIEMNNMKWRVKRTIVPGSDPVEIRISVYRERDIMEARDRIADKAEIYREQEAQPLITLVTLVEDTYWEEVQPIR